MKDLLNDKRTSNRTRRSQDRIAHALDVMTNTLSVDLKNIRSCRLSTVGNQDWQTDHCCIETRMVDRTCVCSINRNRPTFPVHFRSVHADFNLKRCILAVSINPSMYSLYFEVMGAGRSDLYESTYVLKQGARYRILQQMAPQTRAHACTLRAVVCHACSPQYLRQCVHLKAVVEQNKAPIYINVYTR